MRRITALLAVTVAAAAAVPTAASAGMPSYAGEKPSNYGSCVAYEAMADLDSVSDFTGRTSPLTIFGSEGEKIVGPNPGLDETTMSCLIDFGHGQEPVT
jgi:hypothetical protein